jgi:YHS domain-containing protein
MKTLKLIVGIFLAAALVAVSSNVLADGTNSVAPAKPKPDLLKTCPVSGEKLGGDMGKPYVFTYKDQEIKLCCPMCKKDFDKDPAKYVKLIRAADKTKDKPQS